MKELVVVKHVKKAIPLQIQHVLHVKMNLFFITKIVYKNVQKDGKNMQKQIKDKMKMIVIKLYTHLQKKLESIAILELYLFFQ